MPRENIVLVGILSALVSCAPFRDDPIACSGTLFLSEISDQGLRRDASMTIIEFAGLEEGLTVDNSDPDKIRITWTGDKCRTFSDSFLDSEMEEFNGLVYMENRLNPSS